MQDADAEGKLAAAQVVRMLLQARFTSTDVAKILGVSSQQVTALNKAELGTAAEGHFLECDTLVQGLETLVAAAVAELDRGGASAAQQLEHVHRLRSQVAVRPHTLVA
jgi:hypothetical protein